MKRVMTVMAIALIATGVKITAQSKSHDEVIAAEKAWARSYQSCDMVAMGRLLSNDMLLIQHTNGATTTKEQFLKGMATCSIEKVENDPQRVRVYGNTAAVQGKSTYTIKRMTEPISIIYTRVWVKTNEAWQIVNHQSTGLVAAKPVDQGR